MINSFLRSTLRRTDSFFSTLSKRKDVIILFGAPGVGKGTYASLMAKDLGYTKVSPGDEIRKIIMNKTDSTFTPTLVKEIQNRVNNGKLVNDELVIDIILQKFNSRRCKGVILDGFPRTLNQLEWVYDEFPSCLAINMVLKYEVLIEGLLSRRTCLDCGTTYNIRSYKKGGYEIDACVPKKEGVCNNCGGRVVQRPDDNLQTIETRMKEYNAKTLPLLEMCKVKRDLITFEAKRGVRDYPKLQEILRQKLGKSRSSFSITGVPDLHALGL